MIINFDSIPLTFKELLERVSEKEIYEYYLNHPIGEGKLYSCPFHEDNSPSLGFKLMPSTVLIHRCFGCGERGNAISFVSKLYNLSIKDTIRLISKDFNLAEDKKSNSATLEKVTKRESVGFSTEQNSRIFPVYQPFQKVDYYYWRDYYISFKLLEEYNIKACKQVFLKTRDNQLVLFAEYSKSNPIYCYNIDDSYKIYRPLNSTKVGKWLSTTKAEDIQGMKQLPPCGELLIITSSMKDLLVLKVLGYNAIALGGEGNRIPAKILDYLYDSFDNIIVFYDNDKPGIEYGKKLSSEIGSSYIHIPEEYKDTKDISDFIKKYKIEQTRCLIKELIENGCRTSTEEVHTVKED